MTRTRTTQWVVIREVATDELRLAQVRVGYVCPAEDGYRWAGPFPSRKAANQALAANGVAVREQLYGPPMTLRVTL